MAGSGIPEEVRQFIFTFIDSVEQLEVLLLLRAKVGQTFDARSLSEELRSSEGSAANRLSTLERQGFLRANDGVSYGYEPRRPHDDELIGKVEDCYRVRRHKVMELIFSPMKKARSFADAFMVSYPINHDEDDNG